MSVGPCAASQARVIKGEGSLENKVGQASLAPKVGRVEPWSEAAHVTMSYHKV